MNIENVVRKVEIIGSVQGMGQVQLAYDKVTTSADATTAATAKVTRAQVDVERALAATQKQLQDNFRQQQQFADMLNSQARAAQTVVAANDNVARSYSMMGIEVAEAAGHLRTAAGAAYAFSPAFREVVNGMAAPALRAGAAGLAAVAAGMVLATNAAGKGLIELGLLAARSSTALAPLGGTIAMAGAAMAAFNPSVAAVAGTILTRLLPAIRALTGIGLIINVVQAVGDAWELGGRKLEEYRLIAEKAASVDLSTTFFQRLTKGAEDAKVPVTDLTRILQNLNRAAEDALGGSALQQRLQKHLDAGNFKNNPGVALLQQANNAEERVQALNVLLKEAFEVGQRLAALDLAKSIDAGLADKLRTDSEYLDKILASTAKVKETELVSSADIGRAVELQNRYDAAVKILESRWHPIQGLLTELGIKMQSAWVSIVEQVAAAVDWVTKLVMKIAEIPDKFWDLAKRGYTAALSAAAGAVPIVGPVITTARVASQVMGSEPTVAPGAVNEVTAYGNAVRRLTADLQNTYGAQQKVNEASTVTNKVLGDTSKTLDNASKAAGNQADQYTRAKDAVEKHTARMIADKDAVGLGVAAQEELRAHSQLTIAAMQAGKKPTAELTAEIDRLSKAAGAAALDLEKTKIAAQIKFEKGTIGLTSEDVEIASRLQRLYGGDIPKALASTEAADMRLNNQLRLGREIVVGFGNDLFAGLMRGEGAMKSLTSAATNLIQKLASKNISRFLEGGSLFGDQSLMSRQGAVGMLSAGLAGYQSGNALTGALGGAMAGATFGPAGAAIGGLVGAIGGLIGQSANAEKALKEAQDRWAAMRDQVVAFRQAAEGLDLGPLTREVAALRQAHDALAMAALEARDYAALNQIHETLNRGIRRVFAEWMNGEPVLGELSQKIADLNNEAMGLKEVIPDAAAAIDQGLIARIRQVTQEAERGLQADINSARGLGWLNEAGAAIAKFNDLAGKVDPSLLNTWFVVNAQKIIDSSQLTGEAFQQLVDQLSQAVPGIADSLHEFTEAITRTAGQIASSRQSLQDQLFVLQQDQNTVTGALAVFDRQAQREREAEIAAGGELLADLEALNAAKRYQILQQFNQRAVEAEQRRVENQTRAIEDAASFLTGQFRNIGDWIAHFNASPASLATPANQLANAQGALSSQLSIINSGTAEQRRAALSSITQYADDAINAIKAVYGSTATGASMIQDILAQLGALPESQRPEDYIVDAIEAQTADLVDSLDVVRAAVLTGDAATVATALVPHFNALLNPTTGLLNQAQLETKLNLPNNSLDKIFKELDGNGDGILEKSELIKAATQGVKVGTDNLPTVKTNTDTLPAQATRIAGMETSLLALAQVSANTASAANILQDRVNQNLRQISNTLLPGVQLFAGGGYTGGGPADRVAGLVHGQEFVLNRFATAAIGPNVLSAINDNRALPFIPVAAGAAGEGGASELAELRKEVAQLRAMIERLLTAGNEIAAAGHGETIAELHRANEIAEERAAEQRRAA